MGLCFQFYNKFSNDFFYEQEFKTFMTTLLIVIN